MKKTAILMSTYNGERYIKQQIESIISQSYEDITLIIRDDGSSDETKKTVEEIMKNTSFRIEIMGDSGENVGYGESFKRLVEYADGYDYYAFCDQDDYWEKDKISEAIKKLEKYEKEAALYASNYWVCDENLNIIGEYDDNLNIKDFSLAQNFFEGKIAGFTMVFNKKFREIAFLKASSRKMVSHDKWAEAVCVGLDLCFEYDSTPRALYRRHYSTASPASLGFLKKNIWRVKHVLKGDYLSKTLDMIESYCDIYSKTLNIQDDITFLRLFSGEGIEKKMKRLLYKKRLRRKWGDELLLRLCLLFK